MMLLAAVVFAATSPDTPALLPSALSGLVGSSPFAGLSLWVIHRLWKERDEERAAWASERDAERAEWAKQLERELQWQERLVAAVLESTKAVSQSTEVTAQSTRTQEQTTDVLRQVVKVLG